MTPVEFVAARLDEWAMVARGATPAPWVVEVGASGGVWVEASNTATIADLDADYSIPLADAAHIASNDPAAVLRMVEAQRKILALHTSTAEWAEHPDCRDPATYRFLAGAHLDSTRTLTQQWSDHPDWQEEWA